MRVEPIDIDRNSKDIIVGLQRAIEILCNEDYPEVHGLVKVEAMVQELLEEIEYLEEYGE